MFCHVQFCTLNVPINICFCVGFRHVHLCTNDYPYSYGFSSCTGFVRMTFHFLLYWFSSSTFLYEWLSIYFELVSVMYVFLRMTIHFFLNGFSSCTFLYKWPSISFWMGFCHAHFCTNDYHFFLNAFLLNRNSEFLGVFSSNVLVSPCVQFSSTGE